MQSLGSTWIDALAFSAGDLATLQALGDRRGRQTLYERQMPEVLDTLRRHATVESVTSSNRIEGVTAPDARIEGIVLRRTAPRDRSEQEIAGYRDALALVHEHDARMELTPNVVLQLHSTIYRYLGTPAGRWKLLDNEIVDRAPDGAVARIRFRPVRWAATPQAMDDLARLHGAALAAGRSKLLIAPLAILDFLCIHPFEDGNGRVSRLLTLLLLHRAGFSVGRYVSLDRIVEESKETYYEVLERSSRGWHEGRHDPLPWLRYFWGALIRAYGEFEERVGTAGSGRGSKTARVRAAVERRAGPFSIGEIEKECPGTSREMVRHVLQALRDEGRIERVGEGRGSRWRKRN